MFIDNLEETLKNKNINAAILAKETGINKSTITQWRKGKLPNIETLIKISEYLETSLDKLVLNKDNNTLTKEEIRILNTYKKLSSKDKIIIDTIINSYDVDAVPEGKSSISTAG